VGWAGGRRRRLLARYPLIVCYLHPFFLSSCVLFWRLASAFHVAVSACMVMRSGEDSSLSN
jgi:hypothetical protein